MGVTSDVSQKSNIKADFRGSSVLLRTIEEMSKCKPSDRGWVPDWGGGVMGTSMQVWTPDPAVCGTIPTPFLRNTVLKDGGYSPERMCKESSRCPLTSTRMSWHARVHISLYINT